MQYFSLTKVFLNIRNSFLLVFAEKEVLRSKTIFTNTEMFRINTEEGGQSSLMRIDVFFRQFQSIKNWSPTHFTQVSSKPHMKQYDTNVPMYVPHALLIRNMTDLKSHHPPHLEREVNGSSITLHFIISLLPPLSVHAHTSCPSFQGKSIKEKVTHLEFHLIW